MPSPLPLRRADTFKEVADAFSNFFEAIASFFYALVGLLPRVGKRAVTASIYVIFISAALYLFVIHGWAFVFVKSVQAFVVTAFTPSKAVEEI